MFQLYWVITKPYTELIQRISYITVHSGIPNAYDEQYGWCSIICADAFGSVPATHVQFVWQELDYRIYICRVTKGGHTEHL